MKYLLICIAVLFCCPFTSYSQNDAISQYFERYMEDDRFTSVYVSPKMFQLLGQIDLEGLEEINAAEAKMIMEVVEDVESIRVLTSDYDAEHLYKEATKEISTHDYDLLVSVKDQTENVKLWTKSDGPLIKELFLLVGELDEFVMVSLTGDIDLKKISKLAKAIDVEGLEHLEKIDGINKQ